MDQTTIPFLPGMNVLTKPKENYHKSHMFDVNHGIRVDNNREPIAHRSWRPVNSEADLSISKPSIDFDVTQAMKSNNEVNMRRVPTWVAYDRKVMRFYAYFKEAVFSSQVENYRVRKCVIYYYLEDHSIHVAEPKIENSGIPQGVFIKRHRIPKSNNEYVTLDDLAIGAELAIYGRVFRIIDVDDFTRSFFMQNGVDLGEPEDYPSDPFTKKHTVQPTCNKKIMYPMKEHMEASLGKMMGVNIEATQRFLRNDGKVLRFYAMWSDQNMYGEQRPYIVHYFLADDTVEVLEINLVNSGRDPFPTFLQRSKLPKDFREIRADVSRIGWTTDQSVQYYTEEDFKVGSEITVYSRNLFIAGCDAFTKNFYMENYGLTDADFPFLSMDDPVQEVPEMKPPEYNGFGTEEDSLGSFLYLTPKVPKVDFKKLMENDGLKLSFLARFVDPQPEDVNRRFNITFYMNNDTVSIFERFQRNSGFVGGKFLERRRVTNPASGLFFKPNDFRVGVILRINKYDFELMQADRWTLDFMANNPAIFSGGGGGSGGAPTVGAGYTQTAEL
jgi:hypothetical protein